MTTAIHHYMVDYLNDADQVSFANDKHITDLTKAKALASRTSKQHDTGAYVVAFRDDGAGFFAAVGHISFYDGKQSDTDGIVI